MITIKTNSAEWLSGKSTYAYDVNGSLKSNHDGETNGINRPTDTFGQVLTVKRPIPCLSDTSLIICLVSI